MTFDIPSSIPVSSITAATMRFSKSLNTPDGYIVASTKASATAVEADDFNNLDEYYEYLENDTNFQYLDLNTYKYITALRDKTVDENTKKLCSYELFFADFSIETGLHIPKFQSGSNAYPTLELFDDNFDYIKVRAEEVKNQNGYQ